MTPELSQRNGVSSSTPAEPLNSPPPPAGEPGSVEAVRWNARKWVYAVTLVFVIQAGLILFFGERHQPAARARTFGTAVRLIGDASAWQQIESMPTFSDSAAFALANWKGFSRDAWLLFTRPEFMVSDWTEAPQWLTQDTQTLGMSLHTFILSNTMPSLLIADKPLPRPIRPDVLAVSAPTQSELRIEGPLATWTAVTRIELPSWPHTELLTNTVVHALVTANGFTAATVLLASSGLPEADQFALRTVKTARFRPPGRARAAATATTGDLVFKWHTVPPTNTPVGPAGPL
jgi:hypothetical protein